METAQHPIPRLIRREGQVAREGFGSGLRTVGIRWHLSLPTMAAGGKKHRGSRERQENASAQTPCLTEGVRKEHNVRQEGDNGGRRRGAGSTNRGRMLSWLP